MNDKEASIELLKLYPQYSGEYTFLQFLNLFQQVRKFANNNRKMASRLIKQPLKGSFELKDDLDVHHYVFIEHYHRKEH